MLLRHRVHLVLQRHIRPCSNNLWRLCCWRTVARRLQLSSLHDARASSTTARPPNQNSAAAAAALEQRKNSMMLQRALDGDDHTGARALLLQLLDEGSAKPHHVRSVLRRCRTEEQVLGIAERLDEASRASVASDLHDAWIHNRDFRLGADALAYGMRTGVVPLDAASRTAVQTLRAMQRRRAKAAVQRAYVKELSRAEGIGVLPYAYAALFAAAEEIKEVHAAAFQLQQEGDDFGRLKPSASQDKPGQSIYRGISIPIPYEISFDRPHR